MSLFSVVVLNVLSVLATILLRKRDPVASLQLWCGCLCYVSLPRGTVGWSTVFFVGFEMLHDEHAHSPFIGGVLAEIEHNIKSVV